MAEISCAWCPDIALAIQDIVETHAERKRRLRSTEMVVAVDQPARDRGNEPQNPITHDLQRHPAGPGGLGA